MRTAVFKRLRWVLAAAVVSSLCVTEAGASEGLELGDFDERALEPSVLVQEATLGTALSIEVIGAIADDGARRFRDFVKPGVATRWHVVGGGASVEVGSAVAEGEVSLPLAVSYELGPWSLGSELSYTAVQTEDDEWTLDTELSYELLEGWSAFGVAAASAMPALERVKLLFMAGTSWRHERVAVLASFGQGVRDTPFAEDEQLGLLALRLLL